MKASRKATVSVALLLAALFAASVFLQHKVESIRGKEATLEEVLYLPSSRMLKRMSLGYSALLADIYWTRAVQYFGSKHIQRSTQYDLLAPLLEIATDLDPHLIPAYQDGSLFLSQAAPWGAGQPDKAAALLEKGIRNNPEYWRMYFTLGFVHYLDRKDYKAAQQAFEKGSEVPGALPWMKTMAARMAEHAADINTAIVLWRGVYDMTKDENVRQTALSHIASLTADAQMMELERIIEAYQRQTGRVPSNWTELVQAGMLRGAPLDPTGTPYKLNYGAVQVADPKKFPFLGDGRGR
ncbi:MAG TPA: hypothetical protein VF532_22940 [Candidatus Angelobacter sp.]